MIPVPPVANVLTALPAGPGLQPAIEQLLRPHLQRCFGYHLLSVGPFAAAFSTQDCPARRVWTLGPEAGKIRALPECLPLQTGSVDAVLLPFALDVCEDPHALLREVNRVLIASGQLIIVGVNPWSFWGLARRTRLAPVRRRLSVARLDDWLGLLDFEVETVQRTWHQLPLRNPDWQQRLAGLDVLGRHLWPRLGAVYVLVARKRTLPLTLIRPNLKGRVVRLPVRALPTPRRPVAVRVRDGSDA